MEPNEWDLRELLSSDDVQEVQRRLQIIEERVRHLESFKDFLGHRLSPSELGEFLKAKEVVAEDLAMLQNYAFLRCAAKTNDDKAMALSSQFSQFDAQVSNRLLFFTHWWKDVDEEYASKMQSSLPRFRHYLFEIRRIKPFLLSEPEERIINLKDVTGREAIIKQYDLKTSAFRFNVRVDGKTKSYLDTQMHGLITDPRPEVRSAAYKSFHSVYRGAEQELGELYRSRVIDWKQENIDLRHHQSSIAARNISNDIPDDAVNVMLHVVQRNIVLFQDYFRRKAKLLSIEKMSRDHVYAPMHRISVSIPFAQGVAMVESAYKRFSPQMATLAMNVIKHDHLDAQVRPNKEGGAFCATATPGIIPYVLQSYDNKWNDVSTLAHELGHAVHSQLASKQSIFVQHAPLPLAETASIFGEMLLEKDFIQTLKTNEDRVSLIAKRLDGLYASIARQSYFVLFEKQAHDLIAKGATIQEVSDVYYKNLKGQFGPIAVPKHFRYEWLRVSHFIHYPFYVYAYAFGNLLTLALYEKYLEEGLSFVPKYLKLLSYGGSERPEVMLRELDIDMRDARFWQGGMDVVHKMLDELKTLTK
ncbi:M3 family oligoendopeptidase [Candidatus Woesearchaeota archaeon]|nr:M3 family oligoendopeptidase [Candidatus Woesearchaeota archaeon]